MTWCVRHFYLWSVAYEQFLGALVFLWGFVCAFQLMDWINFWRVCDWKFKNCWCWVHYGWYWGVLPECDIFHYHL